jgi:cell division protein FtsB
MQRRSNLNSRRDGHQPGNPTVATRSMFILLLVVSFIGLASAIQLYGDTQSLQADLTASKTARAALEAEAKTVREDAKAASDRISAAENARAAADASLAQALSGKKAARLSLKQAREQLATAEHARTITESRLKSETDELAQLKRANTALEAVAASSEKELNRERAAKQATDEALHASATPPEVAVGPQTTASLATSIPPIPPMSKLEPVFVSNSNRSNAVPTVSRSSTGASRGTRMEECMAVWEPATHMTKTEWRRTCKDTLSEGF